MTNVRRTRASGALFYEPGDIKDPAVHIECKHSIKNHIVVQWEWWLKALAEAGRIDRVPVLAVGYGSNWKLGTNAGLLILEEELDGSTLQDLDTWGSRNKTVRDLTPRVIRWREVIFRIVDRLDIFLPETDLADQILITLDRGPMTHAVLWREMGSRVEGNQLRAALNVLVDEQVLGVDRGTYRRL